MKLGELRSRIRNTKGSPTIRVELVPGKCFKLAIMKASLDGALKEQFGDSKTVETGLIYVVDGDDAILRPEETAAPYGTPVMSLPLGAETNPCVDILVDRPIFAPRAAEAPAPSINLFDDLLTAPASTSLLLDI